MARCGSRGRQGQGARHGVTWPGGACQSTCMPCSAKFQRSSGSGAALGAPCCPRSVRDAGARWKIPRNVGIFFRWNGCASFAGCAACKEADNSSDTLEWHSRFPGVVTDFGGVCSVRPCNRGPYNRGQPSQARSQMRVATWITTDTQCVSKCLRKCCRAPGSFELSDVLSALCTAHLLTPTQPLLHDAGAARPLCTLKNMTFQHVRVRVRRIGAL